ncbi:MAG: FAD:protein FMN transferase [Eggerthellaceae bacterium]|nr:FAD:protein FMN transferase [Eggerthellaceae bacterium]
MGALDPIPNEDWREDRAPAGDAPATTRVLAFNTVVELAAYGLDDTWREALDEAVDLCRAYERLFSRTLPHSDIARLNAAQGRPVPVDARTHELLGAARRYCAASEDAFDVTVGPLVRLWDFHAGVEPTDQALAEAAAHVDWHALELGEGDADAPGRFWARLADPQAAVDVGGIAKGWMADRLVEALLARGAAGVMVNLGGNVAVAGSKPDGAPWRIGIRDPRHPHDPDALLGAVPLAAGSAVTSGVYERCFTAPDGLLLHHVLDPRTGRPVDTDVAGVTVVAPRSLDAEGFSTTLLALGLERGTALARSRPEITQAFFVTPDGEVTSAW